MEEEEIRKSLSGAFIEALGDEVAEMESIYTFLIYIQLAIFKAAYPSIKQAGRKAKGLLIYLNQQVNEIEDRGEYDDLKLMFENNRDVLLEIMGDIWNSGIYGLELNWLNTWIIDCRRFLEGRDFDKSFLYLSKMAYQEAGVENKSPSSKFLVSAFIQLIKSFINTNKIIRIA